MTGGTQFQTSLFTIQANDSVFNRDIREKIVVEVLHQNVCQISYTDVMPTIVLKDSPNPSCSMEALPKSSPN
jgi:hypothetical protein